jgi:hypothetical protein
MLNIRQANLNDVPMLRSLIQEMADYEHLPLLITEQTLATDGFGAHAKFRVLIADLYGAPAGYCPLLRLVLDIPGSRIVLGRPIRSTSVPQEQDRLGIVFACRSDCPTRKQFWSYAARPGLERNCDPVLQKDACHFPRRLENCLPEGQCSAACRQCSTRYLVVQTPGGQILLNFGHCT